MQPRLLGKEFLADHESKLNIKTENFFYAKDIIKRFKKQAIDWEKIFANHTFDKKKIRVYKELSGHRSKNLLLCKVKKQSLDLPSWLK